jgi:subtilisin family serine protease
MNRRRLVSAMASLALLVGLAPAAALAQSGSSAAATWIVQLDEPPVVAYEGGVAGLAPTRAAVGQKINPNAANVQKYVSYLAGRHDAALSKAGGSKLYDYVYSYNGFAARLTGAQAQKLRSTDGVVAVTRDKLRHVDTSTTPQFLGLSDPGGLWDDLGGVGKAGEDVVIGVVDTGIWPESASFSDQDDFVFRTGSAAIAHRVYDAPPSTWHGTCEAGEQFSSSLCNNKLIGARYYLDGFGKSGIDGAEYISARDHDSHGSHTSSTAAGNHGIQPTGVASTFGPISGMAPRARIAAYKVCWNGDAGGCADSDSMAAIDQAVADGVDVINYSIGATTESPYLDSVEVAFLFASRAGVFVSTSAGNEGPGASTLDHPSPWLTTVAAGTHPRAASATLTLGNGAKYTGASANTTQVTGSVILSTTSGLASADATQVAQCYSGTLDPARVTGKIVVCDRGGNVRIDKSLAVQQAGGIGMILANVSANSLNADLHYVPTIHINDTDGAAVKDYVKTAGGGATATIGVVSNQPSPAPYMAAFSSRGPSKNAGGDILKPDLTAPGVDILAAVSPDSGRSFDLLSGTSMASPHVAGVAALLKDAHPTWSPAAIKSALMTTAYPTLDGGTFDHGAGHIKPNSAVDPGLVYDLGFDDYRGFLKGQALCNLCFGSSPATAIEASNLNLASITVGDLAGVQTITRTVTNVGNAGTYRVTVNEPAGFDVTVNPRRLTLAAGASATYTVTIARSKAAFGTYQFGSLTWSDGSHDVKSPITVRPVGIAAPTSRTLTGTSGTDTWSVTPGFSGSLTFKARGLQAATKTLGSVADDPTNEFVVDGPGTTKHTFEIGAGTAYARFALFNADVTPTGGQDLDLYVYKGDTQVGVSGGSSADETVNLVSPEPGTYTVYVHGWQTAGGGTANYTLFSWQLNDTANGNLTVPVARNVTSGTPTEVSVTWSGLATGTRYLGAVDYGNGTSSAPR